MIPESKVVLGAFTKSGKATNSFVVSVRPSVHMEQFGSQWTNVLEILIFEYFSKVCLENLSLITILQE
jgi:hypothetical protein